MTNPNLARALAQMEKIFATPKDPEEFNKFFMEECLALKSKVREHINKKMEELPSQLSLLLKGSCILSGGSISSLYHDETVKDYDLWCKDGKNIEGIRKIMEKTDFANLVTEDDGSEYNKMSSNKFVTKNAITLSNKIQFILLDNYTDARSKFDFVHCLPYYDLYTDKFYISEKQFLAIRHKQLVRNNKLPEQIDKKRIDKFRAKGWSLK